MVGNVGGENNDGGIRGYASAFDLDSGKLAWRFYTRSRRSTDKHATSRDAPCCPNLGPEARSFIRGRWNGLGIDGLRSPISISFISAREMRRRGMRARDWSGGNATDRLYAASIIALHAATGEMAWYYQTTPGDVWDYDATMNVVLTTLTIDGRKRRVLMQANKNGYFYVLDRENGQAAVGQAVFLYELVLRHGRLVPAHRQSRRRTTAAPLKLSIPAVTAHIRGRRCRTAKRPGWCTSRPSRRGTFSPM